MCHSGAAYYLTMHAYVPHSYGFTIAVARPSQHSDIGRMLLDAVVVFFSP